MQEAGAKIVFSEIDNIGGYKAVQCKAVYPDNTVQVVWFFRADDGLMRKITLECPSDSTKSLTSMVKDDYELDS